MAFTATKIFGTIWGNKKVAVFSVAADAASGVVLTGFNIVEACWISAVSCTTNAQNVKSNTTSGSSVQNGTILISSCVSTDVFTLVAIGH